MRPLHRLQRNNNSGYYGVTWNKSRRKWEAKIQYEYVRHHIGYFATAEEAAREYDRVALDLHGDKAHRNFV